MLFLASALTFDVLVATLPLLVLLLAALGTLVAAVAGDPALELQQAFERLLPQHTSGQGDPFAAAEEVFSRLVRYSQSATPIAIPVFLWFATRAFASARTALDAIFDVSIRPRYRGFIKAALFSKARDLLQVITTVLLFLASTAVSGWLRAFGSPLGLPGRLAGEALAFVFIFLLFFQLYRFGSTRRIRAPAAAVATAFAAVAFELARRGFAMYVTTAVAGSRFSADTTVAAVLLLVVWLYYSSLVFLLGGVVAETWELRHLLRRQRSLMA